MVRSDPCVCLQRIKSQDMRLTFYKKGIVPAFGGRAERRKDVSESTARYVPLD